MFGVSLYVGPVQDIPLLRGQQEAQHVCGVPHNANQPRIKSVSVLRELKNEAAPDHLLEEGRERPSAGPSKRQQQVRTSVKSHK